MPSTIIINVFISTGSNCIPVTKVKWLNTDANPLIVFSGGLPIDQADDHHTVTVIQGADHVALDFTSPVIDFVTITGEPTFLCIFFFLTCYFFDIEVI